jgi:hypothetical protein
VSSFGRLWEILAGADDENDGMVALIPRTADAQGLLVPGGDPLEELHVTLQYFSDMAAVDPTRVMQVCDQLATGLGGPIQARIMGHATFNPDGGPTGDMDPCGVYLVSDSAQIADLAAALKQTFPDPEAHAPFLCHLTCGYGLVAADLSYIGPVVFDRLRVALGTDVQDIPL